MIEDPTPGLREEQIIQQLREAAIAYSGCGFNTVKANRIMDKQLRPAYTALKARGDAALKKLLPLMNDDNPTVRWVAAGFAYDVEPDICRRVLEEIMKEPGINAIMAWAALAERTPESPPDPPRW